MSSLVGKRVSVNYRTSKGFRDTSFGVLTGVDDKWIYIKDERTDTPAHGDIDIKDAAIPYINVIKIRSME
jgi:hypothetical protein